jgi:hypothetical protein
MPDSVPAVNPEVKAAMDALTAAQNSAMINMASTMIQSVNYNMMVSATEQMANNAMRSAKTEAR